MQSPTLAVRRDRCDIESLTQKKRNGFNAARKVLFWAARQRALPTCGRDALPRVPIFPSRALSAGRKNLPSTCRPRYKSRHARHSLSRTWGVTRLRNPIVRGCACKCAAVLFSEPPSYDGSHKFKPGSQETGFQVFVRRSDGRFVWNPQGPASVEEEGGDSKRRSSTARRTGSRLAPALNPDARGRIGSYIVARHPSP